MVELTRTNDAVFLSWLVHALGEDNIDVIVLDAHTSVMEGSISAIPRRVMVAEESLGPARVILHEGETLSKNGSAHDRQ
ncbi:MAG: DUF2007 domain-containing protein [Rhodospirillales bacterium]|nr:DUF2007 domain-containing protein [Rhodospirillales bacterium]